ncbi:hypothetical protein [Peribacillus simplex]|uniref:hypothetical protein n=1 Tax=Peribacillus simplex TaxID=1478 RepID=UPI003D281B68
MSRRKKSYDKFKWNATDGKREVSKYIHEWLKMKKNRNAFIDFTHKLGNTG